MKTALHVPVSYERQEICDIYSREIVAYIEYCANWSGFYVHSAFPMNLGCIRCNILPTVGGWSLIFIFSFP